MDQLIGKVLHDRYQLRSRLGDRFRRRTFLACDSQVTAQSAGTVQASSAANANQPEGSRVEVTMTSQTLEILIPSRAGDLGFLAVVFLALIANLIYLPFGLTIVYVAFSAESPTVSNGADLISFIVVQCFRSTVIFIGLWMIAVPFLGLRDYFLQRRLQITPAEIMLSVFFAPNLPARFPALLRANRRDIVKLERTQRWYRQEGEGAIEVPPELNLWAGTTKFDLNGSGWLRQGNLSEPELDWLAQLLSDWLNLPITGR